MVSYIWDNLFRKEEKKKDPIHILKENFLFQDLSKRELAFVKEMVHQRFYRPGEVIFRQGEIGVGVYILVSGNVDIYVENISTPLTASGSNETQPMYVTRLVPGDFFGELSLVEENDRRSATAKASTDCSVIGFFKPDLMEIVERNPSTGVKIILRLARVLGKRLKETSEKVSDLKREVRAFTEGSS